MNEKTFLLFRELIQLKIEEQKIPKKDQSKLRNHVYSWFENKFDELEQEIEDEITNRSYYLDEL